MLLIIFVIQLFIKYNKQEKLAPLTGTRNIFKNKMTIDVQNEKLFLIIRKSLGDQPFDEVLLALS